MLSRLHTPRGKSCANVPGCHSCRVARDNMQKDLANQYSHDMPVKVGVTIRKSNKIQIYTNNNKENNNNLCSNKVVVNMNLSSHMLQCMHMSLPPQADNLKDKLDAVWARWVRLNWRGSKVENVAAICELAIPSSKAIKQSKHVQLAPDNHAILT